MSRRILLFCSVIVVALGTAVGATSPVASAVATPQHAGAPGDAAAPKPVSPPGVHLLRAEPLSADRVELSWVNPPTDRFDGTIIRRAFGPVAPSDPGDGVAVTRTTRKDVTYLDENLRPGQSYAYAVFATDRTGHHAPAATATVQLPQAIFPGTASPATPHTGTGISGRITEATTHTPIADAVVVAYDGDNNEVGSTHSSTNGTYRLDGLPPGAYYVCVDATHVTAPSPTGYIGRCFGAVPWNFIDTPIGAVGVPVNAGAVQGAVDLTLLRAGEITGTTTDAETGDPIGGIEVWLFGYRGDIWTKTAEDGSYRFYGLAPRGDWTVCFESGSGASGPSLTGYVAQCYRDVEWDRFGRPAYDARPVLVRSGVASSGIDAVLDRGGAITGTVTAAGGKPVARVEVLVYHRYSQYYAEVTEMAATNGSGRYRLIGLNENSTGYFICFDTSRATGSSVGYQRQCYQDRPWLTKPPFAQATRVPVSLLVVSTGIDAHLRPAAALSGRVVDSRDGAALGNVEVLVLSRPTELLSVRRTSSSGAYRFAGLTPSSTGYFVCFDATHATGGAAVGGYQSQCYHQQQWDLRRYWPPPGSTRVPVPSGGVRTGVDARLSRGGAVTGAVRADDGTPLTRAGLSFWTPSGQVGSVSTGPDGKYTMSGLPAGGYFVCVRGAYAVGGPSAGGYLDECYEHASWVGTSPPADAKPVIVVEDAITSGVDVSLPSGSGIGGTVISSRTGNGISRAAISVIDPAGVGAGFALTSANGRYMVRNLPPSSAGYLVCFDASTSSPYSDDPGYLRECYDNVPWPLPYSPPGGQRVATTAGDVTQIDASLDPAGAIAGNVTMRANGRPVGDAYIAVLTPTGQYVASSDFIHGSYRLNNLPPSSTGYVICVDTTNPNRARPADSSPLGVLDPQSECYRNVPWNPNEGVPDGVTPVRVRGGVTRENVDFRLTLEGAVTGHVTSSADGSPVANDAVVAIDPAGRWSGYSQTDSDGTFWITGLLAGVDYAVCFQPRTASDGSTGYAGQCYVGVPWDGATRSAPPGTESVRVHFGAVTDDVDAALTAAGGISGRVTAATSPNPVVGAGVRVFDATGELVGWTTSGTAGYAVTGLTPSTGPYRVCFLSPELNDPEAATGHASQCYQQVPWDAGSVPEDATPVPVTAGTLTGGVDGALPAGGGIAGTVTVSGVAAVQARVGIYAGAFKIRELYPVGGEYHVNGLTPGNYSICADIPRSASTQPRCWHDVDWDGNDQPPPPGVTPITVTADAVSDGITIDLASRT